MAALLACIQWEGPALVPRIGARLARLAALTVAWAVVVCVVAAGPAQAHDGVDVTVHTDGAGGVWATVTWADGHPVAEHITALITATSPQGRRVGPEAMPAGATAGTVSYAGVLAAGRWLVSVDVALPAVGHCEADVTVDPANPRANQTRCRALRSPSVAAAPAGSPRGGIGLVVAVPLGIVAAIAAVVLWRRAARKPTRRPTRNVARARQ
jgi:hypothetical protein